MTENVTTEDEQDENPVTDDHTGFLTQEKPVKGGVMDMTPMTVRSRRLRRKIWSKLEIKAEFPAQSDFSGVQSGKSDHTAGLGRAVTEATLDNAISLEKVDYFQHSNANVTGNLEEVQHIDDEISKKEEPGTNRKEENVAQVVGLEVGALNERATDVEAEVVRPFSFYKEGTEEELKIATEKETKEDEIEIANTNDMKNITSGRQTNIRPSNYATRQKTSFREGTSKPRNIARGKGATQEDNEQIVAEMSEEARKEYEAKKEEDARKAQKELMMHDKMFFNIKDRQAEKYFPEIYKKKPRNRRSKLTCQEQKLYIDLVRCFGNLSANSQEIIDENFKKYLTMKVLVNKEQELFQNYLRSISHTCKKDYDYIHPGVEKYTASRYLAKKRECFKYPRFYSSVNKIVLTDEIPDSPPTLQYIRPLLELGSVSKLVLPNILPGMPQPCVTTNFTKINDICPILKSVYKGTYVWNKVVCSQDANAEQLAVPNKCDIVMSASAIRRLIDNQGKVFKYWDMPFTVREYQINEGEKTTLHKVVFIDKPMIRQSQYVPKDRIQLYQKHAVRASAIRTNVRGHIFCGIKPVHELVTLPTLEEVQQEVKHFEEKLKETVNPSALLDDENEVGVDGKTDLRKRKRKHGQVGMFDIEKDIDDLETFGMDSFIGSKMKGDGNKGSPDEKSIISTEKNEISGKSVKKSKKFAEDDLEFLKNELKGIKSQAIKESYKHPEMYRDTYSKENKHETQGSVNPGTQETDEANPGSKDHKKDDEETIVKHDENDRIDKESELHTETNTTDSLSKAPRNTRKTKKDLLSVKNMSSFSERMKQMSTIKSKLKQRTQGSDFVPHTQTSVTSRTSVRTHSVESANELLNHPGDTDVDKETKTELKIVENASDSDSEGEGLVIDVPAESPQKHSDRNDKLKSPEMPTLEKEKISNDTESKLEVKEENQSISLESKLDSTNLVIAVEDLEEVEEKSKGTKRRSTSDISENVTVPKRVLRSSSSRETRGMKQEHESVSTRSRSASSESGIVEQGTSLITKGRRVTRRSLGSSNVVAPKEGQEDMDPLPVKRSRGRCKKNVTECNINVTTKDGKMLSEKAEDGSDMQTALTDDHVDMENDDSKDAENGQDSGNKDTASDNEEEIYRTRNKTKVRRIDSDIESAENSRDGHEDFHHGKGSSGTKKSETKKDRSDLEARKIKKMAEAMKKKIAEAKNKIVEEKRRKGIESRTSGSEKLGGEESKKCEVSSITDGTTSGTVTHLKSERNKEVKLGQDSNPSAATGLDKELENILKLQDEMHGTGTNKGSLAEAFTQKHGMSHCGFPVDDNVTYHQWNIGGINVLIRCKYHGFISGQGLVHISPKIEYQPNFGFEQDTVNEICKNWISVYVRPNSSLLKPRVNPFNSEIMMFENVAYKDLIAPDSLFKPAQAFTDLHVILDKLKSVPVGQYLLKNNPRKDQFTIMKATEFEERGSFDLHLNNSSIIKCNSPPSMQWTPLDASMMLPHQRKMNFIPCTFQPKDAKVGEKKQPQKSKKKKKKKNRAVDS
ncbi:uncharacterized protein LOC123532611 [Mercenaria mercenaria]|uniref:uncharacterized protein LOC123532611 n=1 Tax=Mercenaria mercenaria TaxID=6596 RepID=UPI00234EB86D|nr:uncharacterized protein LOC123532611 [Mercenaria mercenaria]